MVIIALEFGLRRFMLAVMNPLLRLRFVFAPIVFFTFLGVNLGNDNLAYRFGVFGEAHAKKMVAPPADPLPEVTLVKKGAGKVKPLRYKHKPGLKGSLSLAMDMGMNMAGNQVELPTMVMNMDFVFDKQIDTEWIRYTWTLRSVDVVARKGASEKMVAPLKTKLAAMAGTQGTAEINRQGFSRNGTVKIPEGVAPDVAQMMSQMTDSVEQMAAPLPKEPVGRGAIWKVETEMTKQGMHLTQVATYKLKKFTADGFVANVSIKQTAPTQKMSTPGNPTLKSLSSKGQGRVTTNLKSLTVSSDLKMNMAMEIEAAGNSMNMKMSLGMKIRPNK